MNHSKFTSTTCIIGMLPPPVHGMSAVTEYVTRHIQKTENVIILDCSPKQLKKTLTYQLNKIITILINLSKLCYFLLVGKISRIYIGLSIGHGQLYDLMFVIFSRIFKKKLILHHHGYTYIEHKRLVSSLLFWVAGPRSKHIVACSKMANDLTAVYPVIKHVLTLSGAIILLEKEFEPRIRNQLTIVGYVSNVAKSKGIYEFITIAEELLKQGSDIKLLIAGPFQDSRTEAVILEKVKNLSNTQYIGPVYDKEKQEFYQSIDILVFPTHSESEGIVIHEAMAHGIPVISYARGCISEIIDSHSGLLIFNQSIQEFSREATAKIIEWKKNPEQLMNASKDATCRFILKLNQTKQELISIFD